MRLWLPLPVLLLVGCAGAPTPIPDAESAAARLYVEKCSVCHAAAHPKRHTYDEWQHMMTLMEQRIAERDMDPLSMEDKEQILNYLKENAR